MRFVKKVNDRGVLTLPSDVREALGIEEGDIVEFELLGVVRKSGAPAADLPGEQHIQAVRKVAMAVRGDGTLEPAEEDGA